MTVEKRDGKIEDFDSQKIVKVINKAAKSVKIVIENDLMQKLINFITKEVSKLDEPIKVEEIQNAIERALMKYNLYDVEISFHDFRKERERIRFAGMPVIKNYREKLSGEHYDRQNANVDGQTFGGKIGEAEGVILKNDALEYMMTPKFAKLHLNWHNYVHDLDRWAIAMHNCLSYPIDNITAKAATIKLPKALRVPGGIECFLQICLVHLQSQSQDQFGGVALTHLDWSAVPFIRRTFWKFYYDAVTDYASFTGIYLDMPVLKDEAPEVSIYDDRYTHLESLFNTALRKTKRSVHQACESFLHNANTLQSRSGNQLPFTSVNYGTCTLPEGQIFCEELLNSWEEGIGELKLTPIFPCGIFQLMDGVNTSKGDPNYYLFRRALEVLPKRDYPNFANADWTTDRKGFERSQAIKKEALEELSQADLESVAKLSEKITTTLGFKIELKNDKYIIKMNTMPQPFEVMSTMGCRTYNGFDINFTKEYFLKKVLYPTIENNCLPYDQLWSGNQKDGRGNIAPNTVIMPFYAMDAKKKAERAGHPEYVVDYFMDLLDGAIASSRDELIERFNWICAQPSSVSKYMYEWNHTMLGWDEEEGIRSCIKHGTLAIGQLGLAETLEILIGKDQTTEEGMELATKIETLFNTRCAEFKENYKLNFGVYYTPAENLCFTAFKAFKSKYKDVLNVTYFIDENGEKVEKSFFTNSIHVPVYKDISIFNKFSTEAKLAKFSNAGCITYGEIDDEVKHNLDALEQIILYGKKLDLPYIALNFQINECTKCGSTDIDTDKKCCRACGAIERFINWLRRITGYLNGNYKVSFNDGKINEVDLRKQHSFKNIKFVGKKDC